MIRLLLVALVVVLLAACGMALRSAKPQRVDLFGLASLSVPANLKPPGGIRSAGPHAFNQRDTVPLAEAGDPDAAAFEFAAPTDGDLGGVSHDTANMTVILFRPGLPEERYRAARGRHVTDAVDSGTGALRAKSWQYERNTTKKPASTAVYEDPGRRFLIWLAGWDSKFSLEQKKKVVEETAKSLTIDEAKLVAHLDYVAAFPERMRAQEDASVAALEKKFAAAGFPKPVRNEAVEHDRFIYSVAGDPPEFVILYPLGDMQVPDEVRATSRPVQVPDGNPGLLGWYRCVNERWEFTSWGFRERSWAPVDHALLPRFRDPRRIYLFSYWRERLRFSPADEIAAWDLGAFVANARKLRTQQEEGALFRPLP